MTFRGFKKSQIRNVRRDQQTEAVLAVEVVKQQTENFRQVLVEAPLHHRQKSNKKEEQHCRPG